MAREGLLLELRSAVQRAKRTGETVARKNIATKDDHGFRDINLEVVPLRATPDGRHFLLHTVDTRTGQGVYHLYRLPKTVEKAVERAAE
jgi:phage terminase large subunit GpA-like protein